MDIIRDFNRGQVKKRLTEMVNDSCQAWWGSSSRSKLKTRHETLTNNSRMKFSNLFNGTGNTGEWMSRVALPLVKETMLLDQALIRANYRADPVYTMQPTGDTTREQAHNATEVLSQNMRQVLWRQMVWQQASADLSRYGTAILYSYPLTRVRRVPQYIDDPFYGVITQEVETEQVNAMQAKIHLLNYGQHPDFTCSESPYNFHLERVHISELIRRVKGAKAAAKANGYDSQYMSPIIEDKIEKLKKKNRFSHSKFYSADGTDRKDSPNGYVDILHWWGIAPIEGNEDDLRVYYAQLIDNDIVAFQDNPYHYQINPYTVVNAYEAVGHWWGNASAELRIPAQNTLQLVVGAQADSILQAMKNYVFYDSNAGFDPSLIERTHPMGGFVPVDIKHPEQPLERSFYSYRNDPANLQNSAWLADKIEASARNMNTAGAGLNSDQRGVAANTATGVTAMTSQADLLNQDKMENISYGLQAGGRAMFVMLRQELPFLFTVRTDPRKPQVELGKRDIMGEFEYDVVTSLETNKLQAAQRIQNAVTFLMNAMGTGHPALQNIPLNEIMREWWRNSDLPMDSTDVFPEEGMQQPAQQPMPAIPGPGQAGQSQGLPPSPQAAPAPATALPEAQGAM